MKKLIIFGSAEMAELAFFYFTNDSNYTIVAFTVDDNFIDPKKNQLCGLPIVPYSKIKRIFPPEHHEMHIALSYSKLNKLREEKYYQVKLDGYTLASYICSRSVTWPGLVTGDNCFILENQTIQPAVKIGNNVMIWSGNHIGHGSTINDHCYISSHVVISGHCKIGERCFLGVNATLKDFTVIGNDCFISMDTSVTKNMGNDTVAVGASSFFFEKDDRRAKFLKKNFFET